MTALQACMIGIVASAAVAVGASDRTQDLTTPPVDAPALASTPASGSASAPAPGFGRSPQHAAHRSGGDPSATSEPAPAGSAGGLRDRFPDWIEDGIRRFGPITVFVAFAVSAIGIHINEDMVLVPAGYLAAGDPEHPVRLFWSFALFGYLGIIVGDAGWFWLCRTFATRFLHSRWLKRLLHPRRLLEVKHQIDVRGAFVLLAARFIPGTRIPVITMCGMMHMSWWKFLAVEVSCVAVTVTLQLSIGWLAAKAASSAGITKLSHQIAIGVGVTAAVVLATYLISVWVRSRQARRRAPRARAKWLRVYESRVDYCPH